MQVITYKIFRTFRIDGFLHTMKEQPMSDEKPMGQVIQIDEARIRNHLGSWPGGRDAECHAGC